MNGSYILRIAACFVACLSWNCASANGGMVLVSETTLVSGTVGGSYAQSPSSISGPYGFASIGASSSSMALTGQASNGGWFGAQGDVSVVITAPDSGPFRIAYATSSSSFTVKFDGGYHSGNGVVTRNGTGSFGVRTANLISNGGGSAVITWGPNGKLPGDSWENKLSSERSDRFANDAGDDSAEEPDNTGARLTVIPVVGDYGHSDFVYLDVAEPEVGITPDNPLIFFSNNRFASLQLPELAGGGSASYQLQVADQSQTVASGTTIDFTTIDLNGVRSFRLWTSDPGDSLPEAAAFTFTSEGPTEVWQGVLVPEPSSILLAACAAVWFLVAARRGRTNAL